VGGGGDGGGRISFCRGGEVKSFRFGRVRHPIWCEFHFTQVWDKSLANSPSSFVCASSSGGCSVSWRLSKAASGEAKVLRQPTKSEDTTMAKSVTSTTTETQLDLFGGRSLPDTITTGEKKVQIGFNLRSKDDNTLQALGKKSYAQLREDFKAQGYKGKILTAMVEHAMGEQTLDISRAAANRLSAGLDKGNRIHRYAEWINQRGVVTTHAVFKRQPNTAAALRQQADALKAQADELDKAVISV